MKKIGDVTSTADENGEFTDGNVAAGTPPTQLMGAWFNSVQREVLNVLAKAGIPQSATKEDQLSEAITKLIAGAGYLPTGYSYSKTESDDKYATNTALNNGLNSKINTSLTYSISSSESVFWNGSHAFKDEIGIGDKGMQGKRAWFSLSGISLNPTGSAFHSVYWPTKSGTLLTNSDITPVTGTSSSLVMSQNGVTNELAKKFDKASIVNDVGSSTTDVISQGAVTNLLFGVAQGYFDVTDQRAVDTTYTNTTGRPIVVSIYTTKTMEASNSLIAVVNDIRIFDQVIGGGNTLTKNIMASFIVPRNGKYRVSASVAIDKWVELR
ncbi:hypothetical protein AB7309_15640 [Providencia manganoxydans]|uniref:hypothetical protein n=1 Tax=Providencia manganoxydans TaxID=2923283 RepID=UPI0034E5D31B